MKSTNVNPTGRILQIFVNCGLLKRPELYYLNDLNFNFPITGILQGHIQVRKGPQPHLLPVMYPCLPGSPPITPMDPLWRTPWITRFMELPVVWGSLTPHLTLHLLGLRNPVAHPPLNCNQLGNYHNPLKFLRIMDRKW